MLAIKKGFLMNFVLLIWLGKFLDLHFQDIKARKSLFANLRGSLHRGVLGIFQISPYLLVIISFCELPKFFILSFCPWNNSTIAGFEHGTHETQGQYAIHWSIRGAQISNRLAQQWCPGGNVRNPLRRPYAVVSGSLRIFWLNNY